MFIINAVLLLTVTLASAALAEAPTVDVQWKAFRKAYPYHVQGVAISPANNVPTALIIAEPPPHVTIDSLKAVDPKIFARPRVKQHPIGYDGWVKDIVVQIDKIGSEQLATLVDKLHVHLFGTAYKAYVLKIPKGQPTIRNTALDLQVSAGDVNRWLFQQNERFQALYGGPSQPIDEVLRQGRSGVFFSDTPGLVALVIPKTLALGAMSRDVRHFAIDSDIILGATDSPTHLAIIARERTVSPHVLPPLRTETVLLLANAKSSQLSQSYERTNFAAGRVEEIKADWAPIYLSDLLIDSEYGSLLNITDQVLKSWSMGGQVRYRNFQYPKPDTWPFSKPIVLDAGLQNVTFNWNTKGAGYAFLIGDRRTFALNRSGSLPVSYIPGETDKTGANPLKEYEEKAYDYFSRMGDANLVRVVQYAALYQIFREYGIHAEIEQNNVDHPEWRLLADSGSAVVEDILAAPLGKLTAQASGNKELLALALDVEEIKVLLQQAITDWGEQFISVVGERLANNRTDEKLFEKMLQGKTGTSSLSQADEQRVTGTFIARRIQSNDLLRALLLPIVNADALYKKYAEQTKMRESKWIKTPSIVISSAQGKELSEGTGGHNLDSRILRYETNTGIQSGSFRVIKKDGASVVQISPQDAEKVPSLLRSTAMSPSEEALPSILQRELSRATPRASNIPRAQVLKLGGHPVGNRGFQLANDTHVRMFGGWDINRTIQTPAIPVNLSGHSITIKKVEPLSFSVSLADGERPTMALSYDATMDLVTGAMRNVEGPVGAWNLHLEGFSKTDALNFLRTAEVQFAAKDRLQLTGFAGPKTMSTARTFKALSNSYDFSKARVIDAVSEEGVTSGRPGMTAVRTTIEVPSITVGKPSLLLRVRLFFRTTITEPLKQAVQKAVSRIIMHSVLVKAPKGGDMLAKEILLAIKKDLKSLQFTEAKHLDVEIEVNADFGDFYVAGLPLNCNVG